MNALCNNTEFKSLLQSFTPPKIILFTNDGTHGAKYANTAWYLTATSNTNMFFYEKQRAYYELVSEETGRYDLSGSTLT